MIAAPAEARVAVFALAVLILGIASTSCDPGTGFNITNERDEVISVQVDGGKSYSIETGGTDRFSVLLNSSMGAVLITGNDSNEVLFDQFLTWDMMTEMGFQLIVD